MTYKNTVGIVGLGRMGLSICLNLKDKGYSVIGYDILEINRSRLKAFEIKSVASLQELCVDLLSPRKILLLVPAGDAVDDVISGLLPYLADGDVLADAGNSHFQDSVRRATFLSNTGVGFLDVGLSGGTTGARNGACLTIGGANKSFEYMEPLFKDVAREDGYLYVGSSGWGHFVKMIHNGIEYGFLQAIAEGLYTVKAVTESENIDVDLGKLCDVWCHGSIIESRLLKDTSEALRILSMTHPSGVIGGGETGKWALQTARAHNVEVPVLAAALAQRDLSYKHPNFSTKVIAAVRSVFGGHELS